MHHVFFFRNDLPAPQQWTMGGQDNCPRKPTLTSFKTTTHRGAHGGERGGKFDNGLWCVVHFFRS